VNDLIDLIGGYSRFYARSSEIQDFTSGLGKWYKIDDKGSGNSGTLQTSLIFFCSSVLRILGG
jgi:hypothetical protein